MRIRSLIVLLVMAVACSSAPRQPPKREARAPRRIHVDRSQSQGDHITVGQSKTITWTITGTTSPVGVRLLNRRPDIGTIDGGNEQVVVSSGGTPNVVTRIVTGLSPGTIDVEAVVEEPEIAEQDNTEQDVTEEEKVREAAILAAFPRELKRIAAKLQAGIDALPTERAPGRPRTTSRAEVLRLLAETEADVARSLPFPELAAFRDAVAEKVREVREEVLAVTVPFGAETGGIVLVQSRSATPAPLEAEPARSALSRLVDFLFRASNTSPKGTICVLTAPYSGADVLFYPASLPSNRERITSASRLTLYLGRYAYEITSPTYRTSKGYVNLLLNAERVLECPLVRTETDPQACRLLAGSLERCDD